MTRRAVYYPTLAESSLTAALHVWWVATPLSLSHQRGDTQKTFQPFFFFSFNPILFAQTDGNICRFIGTDVAAATQRGPHDSNSQALDNVHCQAFLFSKFFLPASHPDVYTKCSYWI